MPTRSYQYDVFISHSSKDRDWVRARLLPYREQHGLRVCFDLRVDYKDLGDEGRGGKARELVAYMQRRGSLPELAAAVRRTHRDISIEELT